MTGRNNRCSELKSVVNESHAKKGASFQIKGTGFQTKGTGFQTKSTGRKTCWALTSLGERLG